MDTLSIEILNPKAKKLLQDLADMNLIAIKGDADNGFTDTLARLRSKAGDTITLDEITAEVELVRSKRYAK
jgi:hypothetical protein